MHLRKKIWIGILLVCLLAIVGPAAAAEMVAQNTYRVPEGETISDDLYISANEAFIDGRVEGDVVVIAGYVEVKGTITGDLMVMAGAVNLSGEVMDDARMLVGAVNISGRIGDDLVSTGGGNAAAPIPLQLSNRSFDQGIYLEEATVDGDAYLFGGLVELTQTTVGGDVQAAVATMRMEAATVEGNAEMTLSELTVDEDSRINGPEGLSYTSSQPLNVPTSLSDGTVDYDAPETADDGIDWFSFIYRIVAYMAGFATVGWLLLRFRPNLLVEPMAALHTQPTRVLFTGFFVVVSFFFLPVLTAIAALGAGMFWGALTASAVVLAVFSGLWLVWTLSPLVVGVWVGQRFAQSAFSALMAGCFIIVLLQEIPLIGGAVSVMVFIAGVGSLFTRPRIEKMPPQV